MSERPARDEQERRLIADHAYSLWGMLGYPKETDQEIWLLAEADLEVQRRITATPITLPFRVHIQMDDFDELPAISVHVPVIGSVDQWRELALANARVQRGWQPIPYLYLAPKRLAHDVRLLTVQMADAAALIDRVARIIDHVVAEGIFGSPLVEIDIDGRPRLKRGVGSALLTQSEDALALPGWDPAGTASLISYALSDRDVATTTAFDVNQIFLGSGGRLVGKLNTIGLYGMLSSLVVIGGLIAESAAPQIGKAIGTRIESIEREHWDYRQDLERRYVTEMKNHNIKAIQEALRLVGFDPGPIDGLYGPLTERAFRIFCNSQHVLYDYPTGMAAITQLSREAARKVNM
jgi:hypothetical protein